MPIVRDTPYEIVLRIRGRWLTAIILIVGGTFFVIFGMDALRTLGLWWVPSIGLLMVLFGIWTARTSIKITFSDGITVNRRYLPPFLSFLPYLSHLPFLPLKRTISKQEAKSAYVRNVKRVHGGWFLSYPRVHQVRIVLSSGKEVTLLEDNELAVAAHLKQRISEFA